MLEEIGKLLQPVFGQEIKVQSSSPTGGGCINQTLVLQLNNGERVFLKHNTQPPIDFFAAESRGLQLLANAGPRIPKPLAIQDSPNPTFLILEYIEKASPGHDFPVRLAQSLAQLHRVTQNRFGLDHDNYIGSTPQKNALEKDGIIFFRDQRLRPQQELARKSGKLPLSTDKTLSKLCDRLENYLDISGEKPALLHGDLWSGNYFPDENQVPCIFDPAVYFGLREADLAMTELFGRLPQKFYDAYHEVFPLNPGYDERKDLYNLYHLLNHLNLFGESYLSSVQQVLKNH